VERSKPTTQPYETTVPERINDVTSTEQMSEPMCQMRLDQEGRRISVTMMIQGERINGESLETQADHEDRACQEYPVGD
jgi:hypothetical protein